jgi:uncharacterized protein
MPVSRSMEPDQSLARAIAQDGCILRSVVGSTVHGLANPGTDDRDELGVCIEPREYVIGLRRFDHWVHRSQDEGVPSGPGDLDLTIYGLRKFCRLAAKGSPTVLLLLYVDGQHVVVREPLGAELQALAPAFISRRTGRAFLGYLEHQRRGLLEERHVTRTRELSAEHGYDTKFAMHALRIAHQGRELLTTGRVTLPVAEPARSELMAVRRGVVPPADVLSALDDATARLRQAIVAADLPDAADATAIDRFLVEAHERAWRDAR